MRPHVCWGVGGALYQYILPHWWDINKTQEERIPLAMMSTIEAAQGKLGYVSNQVG